MVIKPSGAEQDNIPSDSFKWTYYNNRRVQRNLGVLTPMEKHESYLMAA